MAAAEMPIVTATAVRSDRRSTARLGAAAGIIARARSDILLLWNESVGENMRTDSDRLATASQSLKRAQQQLENGDDIG